MKSLEQRSHAYLIKIWEERRDLAGSRPIWRGSVDDIRTGQRVYFSSLLQLSNYLRNWSGMAAERPRERRRWPR